MASWKRSLFDGSFNEWLRAICTPCCVFGQTYYRLDRLKEYQDALDLSGYRICNRACLDWSFFALPFGISCFALTQLEIRRVRNVYGIEGTHRRDLATAVCCPCCAILRNELEVRTREQEKQPQSPSAIEKPYSAEAPMTVAAPTETPCPGKENRPLGVTPAAGDTNESSSTSADNSFRQNGDDSPRSSAGSFPGHSSKQVKRRGRLNAPPVVCPYSQSSASLDSEGNYDTISGTIYDPRDGQEKHYALRQQKILTPVTERMSEDTMSGRRVGSPPPHVENIPLRTIEGSPPTSEQHTPRSTSPQTPPQRIFPRTSLEYQPVPEKPADSKGTGYIAPIKKAGASQTQDFATDKVGLSKPTDGQDAKTEPGQEPYVSAVDDQVDKTRTVTVHSSVEHDVAVTATEFTLPEPPSSDLSNETTRVRAPTGTSDGGQPNIARVPNPTSSSTAPVLDTPRGANTPPPSGELPQTSSVLETPREPSTPVPPGKYPETPSVAAAAPTLPDEEASITPSGGDKAPFVTVRAKRLLGHYFSWEPQPPTAVVAESPRRAMRHSLRDDEMVSVAALSGVPKTPTARRDVKTGTE